MTIKSNVLQQKNEEKNSGKYYQFNLLLDGMNYFNKYNKYLNIDLFDDPIIKEVEIINDGNYFRIFIQVNLHYSFLFNF